MIAVGQRSQIIQLYATVGLIPERGDLEKKPKKKPIGFKPSSHIVWKKRHTHLFRKSSFSPTTLSRLLGLSPLVVFLTDS